MFRYSVFLSECVSLRLRVLPYLFIIELAKVYLLTKVRRSTFCSLLSFLHMDVFILSSYLIFDDVFSLVAFVC